MEKEKKYVVAVSLETTANSKTEAQRKVHEAIKKSGITKMHPLYSKPEAVAEDEIGY